MLATTLGFKPDPDPLPAFRNYARTLRVIGQDLSKLYPEELEIQVLKIEFLATGIGLAQEPQLQINSGRGSPKVRIHFIGRKPNLRPPGLSRPHQRFTRKYTLDDINRLDEIGQVSRAVRDGKPDIYSLGERLRTVGRIVDGCAGTLGKIVKARNSISFEFRDQQGSNRTEEYTNLALYKYQQRYYAERGIAIVIDPWDSAID